MFLTSPGKPEHLDRRGWLQRDGTSKIYLGNDVVLAQMELGPCLLVSWLGDEVNIQFPVCLFGMCEVDGGAEVWFLPHEKIAFFSPFLGRYLKRHVAAFKESNGYSAVTCMIDSDNLDFKRFAKTGGFVYDHHLKICDGSSPFEEWVFGG